jgi:hypothetical protein
VVVDASASKSHVVIRLDVPYTNSFANQVVAHVARPIDVKKDYDKMLLNLAEAAKIGNAPLVAKIRLETCMDDDLSDSNNKDMYQVESLELK